MMAREKASFESVYEALDRMQSDWGLSAGQMASLTHVSLDVYLGWVMEGRGKKQHDATIPSGMETAVPLIAIYRRLKTRFPRREEQVKWLFAENKDFGGNKPIDVAASSIENLYWVGYYLESGRDRELKPGQNVDIKS